LTERQPVTINYFSPYVIIDGASQGIVNGSFISFTLMFLSALFVGMLWCGWACPAGEPGATISARWRRS
jgi:ferredoxin-type protein NapH